MANVALAVDSISVIVKGHFNAAIFSPLWLLQQNLIGTAEFSDAQIEVITSDIAAFTTGWLNCQVLPDTLQYSTSNADDFERVRDAVVGTLKALPHTPVAALGINRQVHFAANSPDHYHAIGDKLVPKDFWEEFVDLPGMREVVIWGQRPDNYGGRIQIKVEPSFRIIGHIYAAYNDHFNLTVVDKQPVNRNEAWTAGANFSELQPSAGKIPLVSEILTSVWAGSIQRSDTAFNAIGGLK